MQFERWSLDVKKRLGTTSLNITFLIYNLETHVYAFKYLNTLVTSDEKCQQLRSVYDHQCRPKSKPTPAATKMAPLNDKLTFIAWVPLLKYCGSTSSTWNFCYYQIYVPIHWLTKIFFSEFQSWVLLKICVLSQRWSLLLFLQALVASL